MSIYFLSFNYKILHSSKQNLFIEQNLSFMGKKSFFIKYVKVKKQNLVRAIAPIELNLHPP